MDSRERRTKMNVENTMYLITQLLTMALVVAVTTEQLTEVYISKFDISNRWVKHLITVILNSFLIYFICFYIESYIDIPSKIFLLVLSVAGSEATHSIKRRLSSNHKYFEEVDSEIEDDFNLMKGEE